jgi:septal ring factor EnvC (AmiA/AmiB activator)
VVNRIKSTEEELKSLNQKLDELEGELKKTSSELEKTKAHRDDFECKLIKAEKLDHTDEIHKQAKVLAKVLSVAKDVIPEQEKLDEMNSCEIMSAVVAKKFPELNIADKSPEYIHARFDAISEDVKTSEGSMVAEQRKAVISREDSIEKLSPRDKWIQSINKKS